MITIIFIVICIVAIYFAYYAYKFLFFKSRLMNAFGKSGIPYNIADYVYCLRADSINNAYMDGASPEEIAKSIISSNPDIIIETIMNFGVLLTNEDIKKIKTYSSTLSAIDGISSVYAEKGMFYDVKGDAFIMADISPELFGKICDIMKIEKNSNKSAFHEARMSHQLQIDIIISKFHLNEDIYHAKVQFLCNAQSDNGFTIEVGATAKLSLKELFRDIHGLLKGKTPWSNTSQDALMKIGIV